MKRNVASWKLNNLSNLPKTLRLASILKSKMSSLS
jgi:hypothetical protein